MTNSFDAQRTVLRLRLQEQRKSIGRSLFTHADAAAQYDPDYPRSVTMRLLSGRSSMARWAIRELLPLLVLHFLGNAAHRLPRGERAEQ